jgi:hypothetical protein
VNIYVSDLVALPARLPFRVCVCVSLSISDVYPLPSKQPGISRPRAWPEQRQGATKCREQYVRPRIFRPRKEQAALKQYDKQSRKGCPQSKEQEQASTCLYDDNRAESNSRLIQQAGHGLGDESGSGDHSHDQKSRAGHTCGEGPE